MRRTYYLPILFFLLSANAVFSQNKLLMLDGRIKEVKQYELKGDWILYKRTDDPKDKLRKVNKYDVFSAIKADGTEEVIYDPDTAMEGDPNAAQVRRYISGEQYGMASYHKPINKIEGAVVGFSSGLLSFYGPAAVFLNSIILARFNPRTIPSTHLIEPEVFNSTEFKSGYNKYARNKKIKDTLIFGTMGFAVGFTFFALVLK